MEKTVILVCPILHDEVMLSIRQTGCGYDVYELKEHNHNLPDKLRGQLQQAIDALQDYDRILLTFGLCGNATLNLVSPRAKLVIPKVDDCISLLMGGPARRQESLHGKFGMFLTAGWLRSGEGIWGELRYCLEKYGERRAKRIIEKMYENLTYLTVLNTGAYELEAIMPQAREMAQVLHLQLRVLNADLSLLEKLLTAHTEEAWFLTVPPGVPVSAAMMTVDYRAPLKTPSLP